VRSFLSQDEGFRRSGARGRGSLEHGLDRIVAPTIGSDDRRLERQPVGAVAFAYLEESLARQAPFPERAIVDVVAGIGFAGAFERRIDVPVGLQVRQFAVVAFDDLPILDLLNLPGQP
jgi:hypothetical protein